MPPEELREALRASLQREQRLLAQLVIIRRQADEALRGSTPCTMAMPHPLDFLLPFEGEQHWDCTLVLLLPPVEDQKAAQQEDGGTPDADRQQADQHEQQGDERRDAQQDESKGPAAKRQKAEQQSVDGPQHQQPPEQRRVSLQTSSTLLALYSEKFRDWIARWMGGAAEKELEVHCRSEGEVAGYRHLLAFIHSMGKEVPQAAEELIQLLLLAREHAVEPAVLACLQRLQQQVPSLPATACLALLSALETGVSGHEKLQAAAGKLAAAICKHLLQHLGPLQAMLNHDELQQVFASIPYGPLRDCIFADENVDADTEATVLAAFAFWADQNIKDTDRDAGQRIAAICSCIRFPAIPGHILDNYYTCHSFMCTFDPNRELLFRAITSAADLSQAVRWKLLMADGKLMDLKATCERWWLPRPRPLSLYSELESASFEFKVEYTVWLCAANSTSDLEAVSGTSFFEPCSGSGWGEIFIKEAPEHGGQPITWDGFWAEGSRFMHNGAARVRLQLRLPGN
ncbi:hypothetical protein CHLNCDRAFT_143939 [Chlorella variabilis]|uniref:BTB domain-containing protein n=1 Tax=Chlorella variabilis TaxID=554065 RepID=E1ZAS7_CHLVA|nr:hypothetical protein CHLNCDRAFT_143939 [Chlorella variabilis]EFN57315.1 hypothetical protein CHLNCDRAFT_143939 [Chlorella variabilis]|eukprot:XP_005849417.1 hypothetical protein CHLNCDRAFT_143939 [Chlorella variabilis]